VCVVIVHNIEVAMPALETRTIEILARGRKTKCVTRNIDQCIVVMLRDRKKIGKVQYATAQVHKFTLAFSE
jgi:hypothetical protein